MKKISILEKNLWLGGEFWVGWLVRGVEMGGFGPPKKGSLLFLRILRCPGPPLGGPKTGYRGQKLIGWVKKWSKNGEKWEKTMMLALRRRRRPQTGTRSSFFGGKIYDFRFFYEKWGWKSLHGLKKWVTTV